MLTIALSVKRFDCDLRLRYVPVDPETGEQLVTGSLVGCIVWRDERAKEFGVNPYERFGTFSYRPDFSS